MQDMNIEVKMQDIWHYKQVIFKLVIYIYTG